MNAVFIKMILVTMLIFATAFVASATVTVEDEKYDSVVNFFDNIANIYASLGDTTKLQASNQPSATGSGDIVVSTDNGNPFTVYMIAQGWPAVICNPGENPSVFGGKCFVDEGVNLKNSLIYNAGIKDALEGTSTSLSVLDKQIAINNTLQTATLSLRLYVYWVRTVCDSSTEIEDGDTGSDTGTGFSDFDAHNGDRSKKQKVLRFAEGEGSVDEGGSSSCSTTNGTWEGWLSQTIPAPQEFNYSKTQNITYIIYAFVKQIETALAEEEFGFGMSGYIPLYSRTDLLKSILLQDTIPKKENVSLSLMYYEKYYKLVWDEARQIWYGEMINATSPPQIKTSGVQMIYNYSDRKVLSIQMNNNTVLEEFWVMSPFGRKNVTIGATKTTEIDFIEESMAPIGVILSFVILFYVIKRMIFGR